MIFGSTYLEDYWELVVHIDTAEASGRVLHTNHVFNTFLSELKYNLWEEFIYFENADDLFSKVRMISNNWNDFQEIVERAYNKSLQYTTDNFIKQIKENK